jgi:hypothetical protein
MVVRYLLLDRVTYLVLPWAWAAFGFVVDVVILQLTPAGHTSHRWVAGLVGVFIVVFVLGVQAVARVGHEHGLLPGALHPRRVVVPVLAHGVGHLRPHVRLRHVVRPWSTGGPGW